MKFFSNKRLTKEQLRAEICKFAKEVGVSKTIFSNKGRYVNGSYNATNKVLYLDTKLTKSMLLCTFFHELGHHMAALKNKWKAYHFCLVPSMYADSIFNIENKIDQIGEKLWYKYVDTKHWGRYKYSYPKAQKNSIIKNFISRP